MHRKLFLLFLLCLTGTVLLAQTYKVYGKITNSKLEPLAFATIQVKELRSGITAKEDGTYEVTVEPGKYDLIVSMIGYASQTVSIIVNGNYQQNFILEEVAGKSMDEIVIRLKAKDRAEEIIQNVIRNKDNILSAAGPYSCQVYIKAIQQDSTGRRNTKAKGEAATFDNEKADLQRMSMTEIFLKMDNSGDNRIREERLGVKKRGNPEHLFYLSTTEGNFNFYNNLIKVPAISAIPFVSPISYSGLMAYRFKTIKTQKVGTQKIYTISVKPRQLSNATVEGEVTIADSTWVILHTRFQLPSYHLPEYDFFEVEQQYDYVQNQAWMLTRQQFTYYSKAGQGKLSGKTLATYSDYELNKQFARRHFGTELSATAQQAYDKDSIFWEKVRTEPLSEKELHFIRYKDSVYRATNTKAYLDSIDQIINKVTWKKVGFLGQTIYNREKERTWILPPAISLVQPFAFGGPRITPSFYYFKTYSSRKNLRIFTNLSYGLRNNDLNGYVTVKRLYNPYKRGFFDASIGRNFEFIYKGDAWINMLKRSNYYLSNRLRAGHDYELVNGLYLYTDMEVALRRSLSKYKTDPKIDSLFPNVQDSARYFEPYNATYTKVEIRYTIKQPYVREPKEKIIFTSKWPTLYVQWRKGLPGFLGSVIDYDYLEFGMEHQVNAGIMGVMRYRVKSGSFLNKTDLRLVDYKFLRRGDPFLFMNPDEAFQALDSTFPIFNRFYEGHMVHEFNGFLVNKIPLLKKLELREVGGAGFLVAPERNLRYVEAFAGVERIFKWPFNPLAKFKVGVYVVGSAANKFNNPVQFKVGLTTWDIEKNRWR
ncbi:MAG: carboxypeptidase-like regulatory domain-containing protein [Flavisolibacter sp.]|nr:carboxypeptidase-like regulatory domain-containing protein [Flavisolibacter sp.]